MFVSQRSAVLVAGMTVLVPSMSYTGVVMTENAFYPVFLLARAPDRAVLRHPSLGNQALALGGLGLVAFTRIQGLALVGRTSPRSSVYASPAERVRAPAYLRRFVPRRGDAPLSRSRVLPRSVARGDGALGWLGARSGTFDAFRPREIPEWFVVSRRRSRPLRRGRPRRATAVVLGRGLSRRAPERVRLFAAIALPTFVAMLGSVCRRQRLARRRRDGEPQRAVRLLRRSARVRRARALDRRGAAAPETAGMGRFSLVAVCCPSLPADSTASSTTRASSRSRLLPWLGLASLGNGVRIVVAAFALGAAYCGYGHVPSSRPAVVGHRRLDGDSRRPRYHGECVSASQSARAFQGQSAHWVDDALPDGATAAVVWNEQMARRGARPVAPWIMIAEFFNTAVGDVYRIGRTTYYELFLPTVPVRIRRDGALEDEQANRSRLATSW